MTKNICCVSFWQDSTGLRPLSGPLLHIHVNYQILKQDKGIPDHMMPLGNWLSVSRCQQLPQFLITPIFQSFFENSVFHDCVSRQIKSF